MDTAQLPQFPPPTATSNAAPGTTHDDVTATVSSRRGLGRLTGLARLGHPRRPWKVTTPLLVLLAIVAGTALVVAATLSAYNSGTPTPKAPPRPAVAAPALPPTLDVLPMGVAVIGCLDPRTTADEYLVCPGNLSAGYVYDGGLVQPQGQPLLRCDNAVGANPFGWVDLNNGLVHLHEQVQTYSSPAAAAAAIDHAAATSPAAVCSNLPAAAGSTVAPIVLTRHNGASRVAAWAITTGARTWDRILIAVDTGVIRLDVATLGTSRLAPPTVVLQDAANGAVERYITGRGYAHLVPAAP